MNIDKKNKKDISFVQILLYAAIDSHHNIIEKSKLDIVKDLSFFYNNIVDILAFKARITLI